MKILGTDFVLFSVTDLANAVAFYRDKLGLPCEMYSEQYKWAEFNCGNVTLSLQGKSQQGEEKDRGQIALAVEDVALAHREMKDKGVDVLEEPVDYGVCQAFRVLDPDKNLVILHKRADGTFGQG